MQAPAFGISPFCAKVDLWLETAFGKIPLSQVAPTYVIAREPRDLPACEGVVVVEVDDQISRRPVRLTNGMNAAERRTLTLAQDDLPF